MNRRLEVCRPTTRIGVHAALEAFAHALLYALVDATNWEGSRNGLDV